ncbi:hypothetical protein KJ966_26590 [bacterium]|nr:hypothetical protein [bacterium]
MPKVNEIKTTLMKLSSENIRVLTKTMEKIVINLFGINTEIYKSINNDLGASIIIFYN